MRAVVQRVNEASVTVGADNVARVGRGLLVYLGIGTGDSESDVAYLADKIAHLRIFEDDRSNMNLSVKDTGGAALVVSQFTLHGDCRRGRRPSFDAAMPPAEAEALYERFVEALAARGVPTAKGR
ncbi:MAG: D-aminoacyl-tRNA deacylase, partial [Myxococcota bacterium]|nr:D-aminoacyl-tRNA deacylase [Myxococcota bacterium]